jgi:hypothetical protein
MNELILLVRQGWRDGEAKRNHYNPRLFPFTDIAVQTILLRQKNPKKAAELLASAAETNVDFFWKLVNSPPSVQDTEFALAIGMLGGDEAMDAIVDQLASEAEEEQRRG